MHHATTYAPELNIREMSPNDAEIIKSWPRYPDEFKQLDYSLRDKGWIDEFLGRSGTKIFTGEEGETIIGFAILSKDEGNGSQAEFRIALNPAMLGRGYGKELAAKILQKGFEDMGLSRIYLIVRKNNKRAKRLYEQLGFRCFGECIKEIDGIAVDLFEMALDKDEFERRVNR